MDDHHFGYIRKLKKRRSIGAHEDYINEMSLPSQGLHLNPNQTFLRLSQYKEKLKKKIDKKRPKIKRLVASR
jgi:hypothetical protein